MLRLVTFEGVALTRDGQAVPGVQNRRQALALLVVLAARGTRGISRDELLELFWPDGAVKDPRHSLDQLLSLTRSAAGGGALITGTSTLRLDPAGVETDVDAFEAARREHRLEEMVAIYHAPFADGLAAGASGTLERFLDVARSRFAAQHATAVRTLAERAERRGDHEDAARLWRILLDLDALDARAAIRLVRALEAVGRAAEALRIARGCAALLRSELGREDDELAAAIRRLESDAAPRRDRAPPPPPPPQPAGERRPPQRALGGRYRLESVLRPGSIATTYLAVDGTGEYGTVELHLLEDVLASTADAEHFLAVFRRVMALGHANLLPTLDAGVDGRARYIVSPRRPADTLAARLLRERQLPIGDAVAIAADVARALQHAHAGGVRHGDVRPKQVALAAGRAYLCALGVAESVAPNADDRSSAVLTIGSAVYHSPEQLAGEVRLDERADVYALGCVLYEMLVGEPPFGGRGGPATPLKLTQAPRSPRAVRETVPEGLEQVVLTCLARVPADRYASGGELLAAISRESVPSW